MKVKTVLTIAGSDSCSGAGIQADLKTISVIGAYGVSAVTALTAQNSTGVQDILGTPAEFVGRQIDSLVDDFKIDAVKTGMLFNAGIVAEVADKVKKHGLNLLVVDPLIASKNGAHLLSKDAINCVVSKLIPAAFLVAPNIPEAEIITGRKITNLNSMRQAAIAIKKLGAKNVLIKGGHLENCRKAGKPMVDVLRSGSSFDYFESEYIDKSARGTGCVYTAAITTELAKGTDLFNAVKTAKKFISNAINGSISLGKGHTLIHL